MTIWWGNLKVIPLLSAHGISLYHVRSDSFPPEPPNLRVVLPEEKGSRAM